jgi:hypothetical protein
MTKQLKQKIEKRFDDRFCPEPKLKTTTPIKDDEYCAYCGSPTDKSIVSKDIKQFILEQVKESVLEVIGDKAHYHFIQNEQERNNQNVFEVDAYNKLRDRILNKLNKEL